MQRVEAVVDVFCGVGGLTHGFTKEGFNVVAGIDADESCKYAFEENNKAKFITNKIENVKSTDILDLFGKAEIKILIGCAPCQPFSQYSKLKDRDEKWKLLYEFLRLIRETKPDIISMENVPQLKKHTVFKDFVEGLEREGYFVSWYILYAPDYGVPQKRRRLVLFASKFGRIEKPKVTHLPQNYRTVRNVLGRLEPIGAGKKSENDVLHYASKLSDANLKRIKQTPEGGSWADWEESLLLKCHKKKSGKSFKSVYGRMKWDDQSPTITTEFMSLGTGRFGHPEQNRAISLREAALLQTFPKYYKFIKPKSKWYYKNVERHIGNAVPVRLGRIIARSIKEQIGGGDGK